jgi:hypothetical protein
MSDEYLETEREAELLATILAGIAMGGGDTTGAGDRILCDLIEMGLADQDRGPAVYQHWCSIAPDAFHDTDELRAELVATYLGTDGS